MFRIRRIYDTVLPVDRASITTVQEILRSRFEGLPEREIVGLPEKLRDPVAYQFRALVFVAESARRKVLGCAVVLHAPQLRFHFLDFLSAGPTRSSRGIGGALYARVREEARALGAVGLFMECLPDDPALSPNPKIRAQNRARLRFYERFGARPLAGTAYETPVNPGDPDPPYLVYDPLAPGRALQAEAAREIVRAILERKYPRVCPPDYVERVVRSFDTDPVPVREPRYAVPVEVAADAQIPPDRRVLLVANEAHDIHHVRERGYVESPVRLRVILRALRPLGLFDEVLAKTYNERHILAVHDPGYVRYFEKVCAGLGPSDPVYPYVFPVRNRARPPVELSVRAGYYCIDTFTPLSANANRAARGAVNCALTAADAILAGRRLAYAAVRPPGHHAERGFFGGFCYFNNAAIAAHRLSATGPVAILDVDYHHGNGQQQIFYHRADVLTVSIHGHPKFAYPYFSGHADERGEGEGVGANMNIPLPEQMEGPAYREALARALARIRRFRPRFLVVALGLDTARNDPTGSWSLEPGDFEENGRMIGGMGLPTLVVQEGGYDSHVLGRNARRFFTGLFRGWTETLS
ncbi:MAG: acetylpolyamine amidohydrolase [Pseudomonadota bacterium]